ncbi:MAG: leucine-rich repeat protein [Lachnospiraceae bacterium]|nr:leucine-rich repeat protein [Lachnospiraceae bacterium]
MKKKILAFILSGCMFIQNSGLVLASELPLYTQLETEQGEAVETPIDEYGDSGESDSSSEVDKEDTDSASETDGKGDTDSAADTEEKEDKDDINSSTETVDKEDTDSSTETGDKEDTDSSTETGDKEDKDSSTETGQEETENTDASSDNDTEENNGTEEDSVPTGAEGSEQNMTDMSESFSVEGDEGSLSIERDFAEEENEESKPNIQYAYAEQYFDTDENDVSAQSMVNAKGVYFGYTETDAKEHLGVLSEYISDESAILLPHKLGKTYMTEIGEGVFAEMDDKDPSDTSKLPSQSTTNRKLQSDGENKILELINAARIKDGKRPLFVNNTLRQTARRKTLEMFNRNYFGHPNPDNVGTDDWLKKCGYPLRKYAENIAYKYECQNAEKLYNIWKNSKDDYNRMMNGDYRTVGIGVYTDEKGTIVGTMIMSNVIFQNITNVEIEFGYERIGSRAFENCRNLTTIKIPSTVSYIADDAFNGCSKLTIRGKADSYAQTYAESKGIKFKAVTEKSPIEKFGFDDEEIFLEVGDWDYAGVTIKPADYKHLVKITTEGNAISYQADGTVHALAKGTATITARVVDDEEICKIIVDDAPLIPMQSIGFLDKELVLYERESIKPAIQIVPINTTDTIQLSSSNEAVVKVDEDNTGEITALKAGNAVLTVSGMDSNNEVRVSADINVRVVTNNNTIQVPGGIKAVTNISPTLAKVTLPDGYSWKEPQTKLKANDKEPVQSFVAQYNKGTILQDCIIPVSVSKVSGMVVSMDGKNLASSQKLSLLSRYELIPSVKSVGEEVDPAFFDVSYKVDKPAVMSVEKNTSGGRTSLILAPQASGKCSVTVEVKIKDENGRYYGASTKAYGTYKKKYTFQVVDTELISGITVELADENPEDENSEGEKLKGVSLLSDGSIQVDEDATKFRLNITGLDGEGNSKTAAFKAKSNNNKIVKVSSVKGKNDVIEVSVKKAGKTAISITAQDKGKYTKNINVIVKRYSPQMNTKTLTLNKLKADVGAKINIVPADGNPISSGGMVLYEDKDTKKVSSLFDVRRISNANSYEVVFRTGILSNVTKNSYKLFLKVTTEEQGKEYVYPLTIKLKNTKPSVKLKQTSKINLFYKDVSSRLEIDSGTEKIADIYQVNEVYNKPHFHAEFTQDNDGEWSGIIEPQNVTGDNYKKVAKTIELCFVYEDYVEEFSVVKKFTVNSTYKKISLVTADPQVYFYTKTDDNKSVFQIKEKGSKNVFTVGGEDGIDVELVNNVNKVEITPPEDEGGGQDIGVELLGNKKKSLTAKLRVSHSNWRETLTCSLKLTVNKDIPSLVLDKTTVSFNSNAAGIEVYDIEAYASCNKEVKLVRLREADIVGTSSAAKKLFNEKKITISPKKNSNGNTRSLKVCLNASNVKGGTYSYKIYAWCIVQGKQTQQIQRMKPVTLNIKVVDKKPLASLSSKGKIDINDVKNTEIVYTPKLTNVTGNIKSASLNGEYASQFEMKKTKDGKYKIKLKEDSALKKGKYKLYFNFVLDNGIRVETKAFNVKL